MRTHPAASPRSSTAITTIALRLRRDPPCAGPYAAYVGLVDLDGVGEQIAAGADHRAAQLMQPHRRRLVASQAEHTLESERGDTVLLVHDVPAGREPQCEPRPSAGEDRP